MFGSIAGDDGVAVPRWRFLTTVFRMAFCWILNYLFIKEVILRYLLILGCLFLVSCHDDSSRTAERRESDGHFGTWKTDCFTTEEADFWVRTSYTFSEGTFKQGGQMYEDSSCSDVDTPSFTEGVYTLEKFVVTTSGLEVPLFHAAWFYALSDEVSFEFRMGVFVDGDVLYLVHPRDDGSYEIGFDIPFHKVRQ